uniref:RNase H type-1 domain-containing protein n=1 Tax=Brassica oleracea TaxID=3712 RepID=A0A3P6G8G9_BRAOL|nr:unnamed protein product [Brassica oleracea]
MRDMRITSIRFETDCSDLVDMTTNPMDWPTFAKEIEMYQRLQEDCFIFFGVGMVGQTH